MSYIIYKLINKKTRRSYTGATSNLKQRLDTHFSALRKGTHVNSSLQDDFNKGHEFKSVVVKTLSTKEEALMEEKRNIGKRSYNIHCNYKLKKGYIKLDVLKRIAITPNIEKRVCAYYNMHPSAFQRWILQNNIKLTYFSVLIIIREELQLTDSQILEETKKQNA